MQSSRMTSAKKIRTNRENAHASTGPKTARGRAHATQNAFRHGLSLPVHCDPTYSGEIEALVREIAGVQADVEIQELARGIAEAQIDLRRVRYARYQFLFDAFSNPYYDSHENMRLKVAVMLQLLRPNPP